MLLLPEVALTRYAMLYATAAYVTILIARLLRVAYALLLLPLMILLRAFFAAAFSCYLRHAMPTRRYTRYAYEPP